MSGIDPDGPLTALSGMPRHITRAEAREGADIFGPDPQRYEERQADAGTPF